VTGIVFTVPSEGSSGVRANAAICISFSCINLLCDGNIVIGERLVPAVGTICTGVCLLTSVVNVNLEVLDGEIK
jgi:hypothetical protein